jgi:hypothetical protein
MIYNISVNEYLSRIVSVEARTEEDVIMRVRKDYEDGKIILGSEDFLELDFEVVRE